MRTRPLPAHSGADTAAGNSTAATPRTDVGDGGTQATAAARDRDRAQLDEHETSRRRRAPAAYTTAGLDPAGDTGADDDLVRSRVAAQRAAAVRPPLDRPAPRR